MARKSGEPKTKKDTGDGATVMVQDVDAPAGGVQQTGAPPPPAVDKAGSTGGDTGGAADGGYITDTEYTWGYYGDISPLNLAYLCLVNGMEAPDWQSGFTYLELGCGNGLSLNIHAATCPRGEFHAVDLNERHIANARKMATEGRLDNAHFHQEGFADLDLDRLPDFDFVALHGVYSWISPEARAAIREIVRRKVKPGGVIYVSYNALPGWASRLPIREIMLTYAANRGLSSTQMAGEGLRYLKFLAEKNAYFFHENPTARNMVEGLLKHDVRYLTHEYFNEHWNCFYCEDVIRDFSRAGCAFLGSAPLMMNIRDLTIPQAFHKVFQTAPDRMVYETHKSYVLNEGFRRDLFVRMPTTPLRPEGLEAHFGRFRFGRTNPAKPISYSHPFLSGQVGFDTPIYHAICDSIADGERTLEELAQANPNEQKDIRHVLFALNILLSSGQIQLLAREYATPYDPAQPLTLSSELSRAMLTRRLTEDQVVTLASPVIAGGVPVSTMAGLMLLAMDQVQAGDAPEAWAQAFLEKHGKFIHTEKKEKITDKEETIRFLRERFGQVRENDLGVLARLGIFHPTPVGSA